MAIARAYLLNMMGIYIVVLLCYICSEDSIMTDAQAGFLVCLSISTQYIRYSPISLSVFYDERTNA